jgi:transitional endoplasmic reticulum ATPase
VKNFNNEAKDKDSVDGVNGFRYRAFSACQRMIDSASSMIVVDEADSLLNSRQSYYSFGISSEKGQVNRLLDESKCFTVWITNRYDCIDESTKRRFDYSIEFEKLTFGQRKAIWKYSAEKRGVARYFADSDIERLASTYETSAGGIDVALRNAARIVHKKRNAGCLLETVESILKAHLTILDSETKADTRKPESPIYSLEGLNIKGEKSVEHALVTLDRFNAVWPSACADAPVNNMNVLLFGPPGTGKTEFAKYIARRLNRRLVVKQASDWLSCWVGDTEHRIRQAFHEAEKDKSILFVDEADSFLYNREGAVRSWEVTQVNELLCNMEKFKGLLICSTNFKKIVDSAAIRRFGIKLEFDYLKPEGNRVFYDMFLTPLAFLPPTADDVAQLGSLRNLAPGDFKVVRQQFAFFDKKDVTHDALITALRQELDAKGGNLGKNMGFGK